MLPTLTNRPLLLLSAFVLSCTLSLLVLSSPSSNWTPLDLPVADASSGVELFGVCVDGDDFVWCLDKSCSMGWVGWIGELKTEVAEALDQLSPTNQFSIVAFSSNSITFSSTLLSADPANVIAAQDWLNAIAAEGSTCLVNGLVTALGIANQSSDSRVILIGDGAESCGTGVSLPAILADVAAANPGNVPIDAFYMNTDATGLALYQAIAAENNGVFVDTNQPLDFFRRGDVSQDGIVDVTDPIFLLAAGFIPGSPQPECTDAADADDNGEVEVLVDSIYLLLSLFIPGSPAPPFPSNSCGADPTPDGLTCTGVCP